MCHPATLTPELPPVVDEYIEQIQAQIRLRVVTQRNRDTLHRRFGPAAFDRELRTGMPLERALTGCNVDAPSVVIGPIQDGCE